MSVQSMNLCVRWANDFGHCSDKKEQQSPNSHEFLMTAHDNSML